MRNLLLVRFKGVFVSLPIAVFVLLVAASTHANLISSTTDPFEGAIVGANSGMDVPQNPGSADMFLGANPEIDPTDMTFFSSVGAGNVSFVEFQVPFVALTGVRLLSTEDGGNLNHRRSMSNFKLFADLDLDTVFETLLVNQAININYDLQPGNAAGSTGELDLTFNFGAVIARSFRAEFVQGVDLPPFDGVRVVELDAIGTPIPEPTTMLLLGTGLVGVAGAARRRKKNQA